MIQEQPPAEKGTSSSEKSKFRVFLEKVWDKFIQKKKSNITLCLVILLVVVVLPSAKEYYQVQPKQIRINNLVTKSFKWDVYKMAPFSRLENIEKITMNGVLLDLNSTTINVEKTAKPKVDKAIADCLKSYTDLRLGSQNQSQEPYHTLTSKKGVADFNFETKNSTIEFSKMQEGLCINVTQGKIEGARVAFENEDLIALTSNSDMLCNSVPIKQKQDWHVKLTRKKDLFLIRYEPRNEPHTINFYFKANSLETPKDILAISKHFPTEIKNLLLTDAEGLISIGKDHVKLEEYDILEIKDLKNIESKFNLSTFQLGQEGIIIKANGSAADIRLNGEQLIKSKLVTHITEPKYHAILATLLIILSNFVAYIFKKFFPERRH